MCPRWKLSWSAWHSSATRQGPQVVNIRAAQIFRRGGWRLLQWGWKEKASGRKRDMASVKEDRAQWILFLSDRVNICALAADVNTESKSKNVAFYLKTPCSENQVFNVVYILCFNMLKDKLCAKFSVNNIAQYFFLKNCSASKMQFETTIGSFCHKHVTNPVQVLGFLYH